MIDFVLFLCFGMGIYLLILFIIIFTLSVVLNDKRPKGEGMVLEPVGDHTTDPFRYQDGILFKTSGTHEDNPFLIKIPLPKPPPPSEENDGSNK